MGYQTHDYVTLHTKRDFADVVKVSKQLTRLKCDYSGGPNAWSLKQGAISASGRSERDLKHETHLRDRFESSFWELRTTLDQE